MQRRFITRDNDGKLIVSGETDGVESAFFIELSLQHESWFYVPIPMHRIEKLFADFIWINVGIEDGDYVVLTVINVASF